MDNEAVAAAVQLAANILIVELTFDRERNVQRDVAIAGMEIEVGGEVGGNFQVHAAVGSADVPGTRDARTGESPEGDVAIAGSDINGVETAGNADGTVASVGAEIAFNIIDFKAAVAAVEIHFTFEVVDRDTAVAGAQRDFAFARHVNLDEHAAFADVKYKITVRKTDFDFNGVAGLALENLDAVFADLPNVR